MCLGLIFKQALHRMALMFLYWEKHFPAEVLNTVKVMRREMRPRRLSPILPKWAFLHNTFWCLSSLTLNYSNCGHPWSNLFCNWNLNEPLSSQNNPLCMPQESCMCWFGMRYGPWNINCSWPAPGLENDPVIWARDQLKANQLAMCALISL